MPLGGGSLAWYQAGDSPKEIFLQGFLACRKTQGTHRPSWSLSPESAHPQFTGMDYLSSQE